MRVVQRGDFIGGFVYKKETKPGEGRVITGVETLPRCSSFSFCISDLPLEATHNITTQTKTD